MLAGASPVVKYKTEHASVSMPSVPYEEDSQLEWRLQESSEDDQETYAQESSEDSDWWGMKKPDSD